MILIKWGDLNSPYRLVLFLPCTSLSRHTGACWAVYELISDCLSLLYLVWIDYDVNRRHSKIYYTLRTALGHIYPFVQSTNRKQKDKITTLSGKCLWTQNTGVLRQILCRTSNELWSNTCSRCLVSMYVLRLSCYVDSLVRVGAIILDRLPGP